MPKQCGRCREWDRLGLSRYCPACDPWADPEFVAERQAERDADQVVRKAFDQLEWKPAGVVIGLGERVKRK
jgi:hypothetical protein